MRNLFSVDNVRIKYYQSSFNYNTYSLNYLNICFYLRKEFEGPNCTSIWNNNLGISYGKLT